MDKQIMYLMLDRICSHTECVSDDRTIRVPDSNELYDFLSQIVEELYAKK